MNKVMNGYTIIATEYKAGSGYLIMGMRRNHAGEFTYVTGWVMNLDLDVEWFWGHYGGTDFKDTIAGATDDFIRRMGG